MTNRLLVSIGGQLSAKHSWSINLNYVVDTLPSPSSALSAANAVMTAINGSATIKGMLRTDDTFVNVRMTGYPALTGPASVSATSTNSAVNGTSSIATAPQVCVVTTLRSSTPGRSFRGRLYLPARFTGSQADGSVTGPMATAAAAIVNAINDQIIIALAGVSVAASWVVYSKTVPAATPVVSLSVGNMCDTQRRRIEVKESYTNFPLT